MGLTNDKVQGRLAHCKHYSRRVLQRPRGAGDRDRVLTFWRARTPATARAATATGHLQEQACEQQTAQQQAQPFCLFLLPRADADSRQCQAEDR